MKILLTSHKRYAIPANLIEWVQEVECVKGNEFMPDAKWKVVGEADGTLIKESQIIKQEENKDD